MNQTLLHSSTDAKQHWIYIWPSVPTAASAPRPACPGRSSPLRPGQPGPPKARGSSRNDSRTLFPPKHTRAARQAHRARPKRFVSRGETYWKSVVLNLRVKHTYEQWREREKKFHTQVSPTQQDTEKVGGKTWSETSATCWTDCANTLSINYY